MATRFIKFGIMEIWIFGNLELWKFEVEEIWKVGNLELNCKAIWNFE